MILLHHCWTIIFLPVRAGSLLVYFFSSFYDAVWSFTAGCDVTARGHRCVYQECLSGERKRTADIRSMKNCVWNVTAVWPSPRHQGITGGSVNKAVSCQFKPFKLLISQQQPPNNQFSTVSVSLIFLVWGVSEGKDTLITKNNMTDLGETVVFSDIFYFLGGVLFVFLLLKLSSCCIYNLTNWGVWTLRR